MEFVIESVSLAVASIIVILDFDGVCGNRGIILDLDDDRRRLLLLPIGEGNFLDEHAKEIILVLFM